MKRSLFPLLIIYLGFLLFHFHCANPGTPQGGPKDTSPPEVREAIPSSLTTRFEGNDIRITFNEFVNLNNPNKEILISPPLRGIPGFKLRGKTVIIQFNDTLQPNTTYTIRFGKAISDITESNVLGEFIYIFSTGVYIDSLMIAGRIVDAFNNKPLANMYAFLYLDIHDTIPPDSVPMMVKPDYLTRTDDQGNFTFQNIPDHGYRLFALDDQSGDLLFNQTIEKIGFSDSLIHPWQVPVVSPDSLLPDSSEFSPEKKMPLILRLFENIDSTQEVSGASAVNDNLIRVILRLPPNDPKIKAMNADSVIENALYEYSRLNDTILLWTNVELPDTLNLEISDLGKPIDTVSVEPPLKPEDRKGKKDKETKDKITLKWNLRAGSLNHFRYPLLCTFPFPVIACDSSKIKIISEKDTLNPHISFIDTIVRTMKIDFPWKEHKTYKAMIPDSTIFTFNGLTNDSVVQTVRTINSRDFGSLYLDIKMENKPGSYIIQLLTEKETLAEEQYITESARVVFAFIPPGKYLIKAILDVNFNKRWDTGNFVHSIQPEEVFYFPATIEVRGNWEVEESWVL